MSDYDKITCARCGKSINLEDSHGDLVAIEHFRDRFRYPTDYILCFDCFEDFYRWVENRSDQ